MPNLFIFFAVDDYFVLCSLSLLENEMLFQVLSTVNHTYVYSGSSLIIIYIELQNILYFCDCINYVEFNL